LGQRASFGELVRTTGQAARKAVELSRCSTAQTSSHLNDTDRFGISEQRRMLGWLLSWREKRRGEPPREVRDRLFGSVDGDSQEQATQEPSGRTGRQGPRLRDQTRNRRSASFDLVGQHGVERSDSCHCRCRRRGVAWWCIV
jgi:hypothetical protein